MCLHTTNDVREKNIEKVKRTLINSTNIEDSPEEMKQLHDILFRLDQCGFFEQKLNNAEWIKHQNYVVTENGNEPIGEPKLKCSRCGYVSEKFDNYCGGCGYPMENSYVNQELERLKFEFENILEIYKHIVKKPIPVYLTLNRDEMDHLKTALRFFIKKHTHKMDSLGIEIDKFKKEYDI